MADNVPITAGTGTNIATDDVGGVHYQRVKLVDGTLEGTAAIAGDATNGLDVDVTRIANVANIDYDTTTATSNQAVMGLALPGSGGPVAGGTATNPLRTDPTGSTAQPVTDNGSTLSVDDGAGSLTVDGSVSLAAAIPAGSNKIGAVDLDSDATIASAVPTVAQFVAGTDGTNARALKTDTAGELQVDVLTLPALVAGTANIGDVDIASVAAGTTIEAVGDVAHDAVAAGNPVLNGAFAETPEDTAPGNQVSAEADVVRIAADRDGALYTRPHPPRIWHASNEYTTQQTDVTVKAAPGAGLSLYITDIYLGVNGAVTVTLEEGTTTLKWRYYATAAGDGVSLNFSTPIKLTANTALTITTSAAVTLTLVVAGWTGP